MLQHYPEAFERDMACTEAQWLQWLPGAVGQAPLCIQARQAEVPLPGGRLLLRWREAPARVIGLVRLPRLIVRFQFEGVGQDTRVRFMRYFDLYMQRGGG
ncbi:MAG TPA: hypothetical protein VNO84_10120 [Burkholderiaceae bacterium]|nr:hypothetical protein [Burkholderiaceae bacterium]